MDNTIATRPMSEILKAADAPLAVAAKPTNGQSAPMAREETEEKVISFLKLVRTTTSAKLSDAKTELDNFEKELELRTMAAQDSFHDLFKLVGSLEAHTSNVKEIIEEIARKYLR